MNAHDVNTRDAYGAKLEGFRVLDWVSIHPYIISASYGPCLDTTVRLVKFTTQGVEDPRAELIGIYYYAGTRRYWWDDRAWIDIDINIASVLATVHGSWCRSDSELLRLKQIDLLVQMDKNKRLRKTGVDENCPTTVRIVYHDLSSPAPMQH